MNSSFTIIIPARYASTRLPGKPLRQIAGKPLIQHVYDAALKSSAEEVYVATDDSRIYDVVLDFGGKAVMTSGQHESGTDRLAEAAHVLKFPKDHIVVNLQGDEPGMSATVIEQAVNALQNNQNASISTIAEKIVLEEDINDPNIVKVVMDQQACAIYFSRSVIPFQRDESLQVEYYRHVGLYAYRAGFLQHYTNLPVCDLEQVERLEQLRALYYGESIAVAVAEGDTGIGIDTEEDVERWLQQISS